MTNRHHRIDYIEIAAPDLDAAKTFYADVFGWEFTDYGPSYAGIRGANASDPEVGGLSAMSAPGTNGPLVLAFSDDLDATVEAVRRAGGTITEGPYEFPGGRRFHFNDPAGNQLGVWSEG